MIQKNEGRIAYISPRHDFGFISVRHPDGQMEKFFFHIGRIIFSEVEQDKIIVGMWARFAISDQKTKRPDDAKYAIGIEIYISDPKITGMDIKAREEDAAFGDPTRLDDNRPNPPGSPMPASWLTGGGK